MGRKLKDYISYTEGLDVSSMTEEARKKHGARMLTEIAFFQHERLVHLIVTVTFAIIAVLVMGIYLITEQAMLLVLLLLVMILLIPYVRHYYLLENGVQRLYDIYDEKFPIVEEKELC